MKRNVRSFLAGCLVTLLLSGTIGAVAAYQRQATLDYTGIKITLDGRTITPTDANGNAVEPFAISGTTYLPVRAVANAMGLNVSWDQSTQTVRLTTPGASTPTTTTPPTSTVPNYPAISMGTTVGAQNALESAKQYLAVMPFSYSGLIDQLEYEGYTTSEATYAVDNCGANWYEQAVKSAQSYLDVLAFSRQGLVDQLLFEGFTEDQAEYGVANSGADWYEQAAKSAQSYLDVMAFSRQGLIDQLLFEGFTQDQAEYGVAAVGY